MPRYQAIFTSYGGGGRLGPPMLPVFYFTMRRRHSPFIADAFARYAAPAVMRTAGLRFYAARARE